MIVPDRTVREVMEADAVEVRPDLPVKELIEVPEGNQTTGATVVDAVGGVSTRDVRRLATREEEAGTGTRGSAPEDADG